MNTVLGGRNFRVGVELGDDVLRPRLYLAGLRIAAVVQVYADEIVLFGEHEADAVVATLFVRRYRLRVASPGVGVGAAGLVACKRGVRDLGQLAVSLFRAPTYPLPQISYVCLRVYYHVKVLKVRGGRKALPAVDPA